MLVKQIYVNLPFTIFPRTIFTECRTEKLTDKNDIYV